MACDKVGQTVEGALGAKGHTRSDTAKPAGNISQLNIQQDGGVVVVGGPYKIHLFCNINRIFI